MAFVLPRWSRWVIAAVIVALAVGGIFASGYNKWWGPLPHKCERYGGLCTHTACETGTSLFSEGVCYDPQDVPETLEVCCLPAG